MTDLLTRLQTYIVAHPATAFFNPPATPAELAELDAALAVPLPGPYRQFLLLFNGGFINTSRLDPTHKAWSRGTAGWNSNAFLGTREIAKEYAHIAGIGRDVFEIQDPYPYVPFLQTANQETLVLGPVTARDHPVLDAFHEVPPDQWGTLAPAFQEFLKTYLDGEGTVTTIASVE